MIHDLKTAGSASEKADIAIIGAGTAGLLTAVHLARRGLSVVCIESGGERQDEDEHPLNTVVHARSVYNGAAHGRFRCLGGTSTRWGGALIPFQKADVADAGWAIPHDEITAYLPAVEAVFGVPAGPYEAPDGITQNLGSHVTRLAKWPPFPKRNVYNLFQAEVTAEAGPRVWLNATVTDFDTRDGGLCRIEARAPNGNTLAVEAGAYILAAGAIETTRLLLLLDEQTSAIDPRAAANLGMRFHDHLSVPVGDLAVTDRAALNRLAGLRFEANGSMRNLRFELADRAPDRATVLPCFAHIAPEEIEKSGFMALRNLFRSLQQRRLPSVRNLFDMALSVPWLTRAAWWRYVEKRLLYADGARIQVHMVVEQLASDDNRIRLSADRRDVYGQRLAEIEWSVSPADRDNLTRAVDSFAAMWAASPVSRLGAFVRRPAGAAEDDLVKGGGIYHPGGTTRMGLTPDDGVVDRDLRVFGLDNLYVLSTSVLPTGGGANPTMMLLMLAMRCIDHLSRTASATTSARKTA